MADALVDGIGDPLEFGGDALVGPSPALAGGLAPLAASYEADDYETQLKACFMQVFENMIRQQVARINTYGMPHRGDLQTVERFVKADGLALQRLTNTEPYLRELYRGWRVRNPKRGLHFLRFYLQLLFPNAWTLVQLWQDPTRAYPGGASEVEVPGYVLTSRVRLYLTLAGDIDGSELSRLTGVFRSVLPARMVLESAFLGVGAAGFSVALVALQGDESQDFVGTIAP